jgi:hypothetical protein
MTKQFNNIISIIENLKIPTPDVSKKKTVGKEINILESRFVGTMYDDILRKKIESLNSSKKHYISEDSIYRYTERNEKTNYQGSIENIHKDLVRKYNSNSYKDKIDSEIIFNTAKYLTKLICQVDFSHFNAKEIIILDAKLGYPSRTIDNFGRERVGTSFKPDLIIDDLIVDIKTYDEIKFNNNMFIQLFLYYIRFNHVFNKTNSIVSHGAKITKYKKPFLNKRLGIYFSKHNYLWSFNVSDLCSQNELDILINFCTLNIKANNLDFPEEIESLFSLVRMKKFIFRTNKKQSDSLNMIQKNKLKQIEELITLRKTCKNSETNEIISEFIIELNKEYCYSRYDLRYRINHEFDYRAKFALKYDEAGNSYEERIMEFDDQLIGYTKVERLLINENRYLTKSIEDLVFLIKHINKLTQRITKLENAKLNDIANLVKFELEIIEQYFNEMLHSK